MKEYLRKEVIWVAVALLTAIVLYALSNSLSISEPNQQLIDSNISEVEETYLKLFQEFKTAKLDQNALYNPAADSNRIAVSRNPFAVPKLNPSKNGLVANTSVRNAPAMRIFQLMGILWDKTSPSAIIDKKVVHVGSRVGAYRVVQIWPRKVLLKSHTNQVFLRMPDQSKRI